MTEIEEIRSKLNEMKSHYQSGFSSMEQSYIEEVHYKVFLKPMQKRNGCMDCYRDGYLLISNKLATMTELPKKSAYKLKAGVVASSFGSSEFYVLNMPEEAAEKWLKEYPERINLFQEYPEDWEERIKYAAESKITSAVGESSTEAKETRKKSRKRQ